MHSISGLAKKKGPQGVFLGCMQTQADFAPLHSKIGIFWEE